MKSILSTRLTDFLTSDSEDDDNDEDETSTSTSTNSNNNANGTDNTTSYNVNNTMNKNDNDDDGINTTTTTNSSSSNVVMNDYHDDPELNEKNDDLNTQYLLQLLLKDTVIGHNASISEMKQYATQFMALGLHSEEMIIRMRSSITPQHIQDWKWMKPFHQLKFSQWLFGASSFKKMVTYN